MDLDGEGGLTKFTKMGDKPNEGLAFDKCFGNTQSDCKTISCTCATAKLINDDQTVFVNVSAKENYQKRTSFKSRGNCTEE